MCANPMHDERSVLYFVALRCSQHCGFEQYMDLSLYNNQRVQPCCTLLSPKRGHELTQAYPVSPKPAPQQREASQSGAVWPLIVLLQTVWILISRLKDTECVLVVVKFDLGFLQFFFFVRNKPVYSSSKKYITISVYHRLHIDISEVR